METKFFMQTKTLCKWLIVTFALIYCVTGCEGKSRDQLYVEGMNEVKNGKPEAAVIFFRNALEKDQNFFDARYQLALVYTKIGKYEQGKREFLKLARQNPSHFGIKLGLARLYNLTGKPDMAISEAKDCLAINPGDASVLEILGTSYAIKKIPSEAEKYLLGALRSDPGRTTAKLELIKVYAISGKEEDARNLAKLVISNEPQNTKAYYLLAMLESGSGHRDRALNAYQRISQIDPHDIVSIYRIGLIYLQNGDTGKAETIAGSLKKKYPKRPEGYRLNGIVCYYKKNFKEAIAELLNSTKIQPTLDTYYFLGLSQYNSGELETALSQFRKILDYRPDFTRARILTGMILLKQKRIDDSISELKKVTQQDGNNAMAHNLLGSAYMAKGMYEEGMKEFDRATEINPKIIDAYIKKGIFHLSKGAANEAEIDFKTAVRVAPDSLDSRLALVSYYMRMGNSAKALSVLKGGLAGNKSDAVLYNNMAGIMFAGKQQVEALKFLQKAKDSDPTLLASYFNMAAYYAALGDNDKALQQYRAILENNPENVIAMIRKASLLETMGNDREAYITYKNALATRKPAAFLALAGYHLKKKEPDKALSVLGDAIKIEPGNAAVLEMKGRVYLGEKKYREAIKVFCDLESIYPGHGLPFMVNTYMQCNELDKALEQAQRIISLKPDSAYGHMVLASVYERRNDLGRAIDAVKEGIKTDGNNIQAYMMLGNLYEKNKEPDGALHAFDQALAKNSNFIQAYFAQGTLLEKMGKKKEAVRKYRQLLGKSENFLPALNNLSFLCSDGYCSAAEAMRLAQAAYKQNPDNPAIMDTLGYAQLKNGRKSEARKVLEKAAALLPDNPTVMYHLALAYNLTGDSRLAAQKLRMALQKGDFPEKSLAANLSAKLKNSKTVMEVK